MRNVISTIFFTIFSQESHQNLMWKVVTSSNLNPPLKLFFNSPILANKNLLLKIYCENIILVFLNFIFPFFLSIIHMFLFFFPLFFSSTPFPYLYLLWHFVWNSRSTFLLFFSSLAALQLELSLTHKYHPSSLCISFFFFLIVRKLQGREKMMMMKIGWFWVDFVLGWFWVGFGMGFLIGFELILSCFLCWFWVIFGLRWWWWIVPSRGLENCLLLLCWVAVTVGKERAFL